MFLNKNTIVGGDGKVIAKFRSVKQAKLALEAIKKDSERVKTSDILYSEILMVEFGMRTGLTKELVCDTLNQMKAFFKKV